MNSARSPFDILIIEDVDLKFEEVESALHDLLPFQLTISRATSVVDAEDRVAERAWDLVVLDISMDISCGSAGPMRAGHANLGGMDVIERMYLLEKESPTLIVTGFDYFPSAEVGDVEMLSLSDLEARARVHIGDRLLGCVRYGTSGWRDALKEKLQKRFSP